MKNGENTVVNIGRDFYGAYLYGREEIEAASKVIENKSPFRYYGNKLQNATERFENYSKSYFGVDYCHTVNSGTSALLMALHALDIGPGDEVIIPGYFFSAVYSSILLRGSIPVLVEIDESLNMCPIDLNKKISDKTKCIIVIHMDGIVADISKISKIASKHGIFVIEDFSQSIGSRINEQLAGSFSDISITSFQMNKLITSGEGGMLLTNNKDYYRKMVSRSDIGYERNGRSISESDEKYLTYGEGRRFNEISSAIMLEQLKKLDYILENLRFNKNKIVEELGDIRPIKYRKGTLDEGTDICSTLTFIFETETELEKFRSIYINTYESDPLNIFKYSEWGYHVYYNCKALVNKLEVLPGDFPWSLVDKDSYNYEKGVLPITDEILSRSLGIKLNGNIGQDQIEELIFILKKIFRKYRKEEIND